MIELESIRQKIHEFQQNAIITDEITQAGRIYQTPAGNKYPSVTTVLGAMSDNTWLEDWRNAVGREKADAITRESAQRGTEMHALIENYLQGYDIDKSLSGYSCFNKLKIYLSNITPLGIEVPLWSDRLKVAGRTDCIGLYHDKLCIIDFKSSRTEKRPESITSYFHQTALYSMMLHERLGLCAKQVVILIGPQDGFPQEFQRDVKPYIPDVISIVHAYHKQFGTGK